MSVVILLLLLLLLLSPRNTQCKRTVTLGIFFFFLLFRTTVQQSQLNLKCALNDSNWIRWPVKEDTQQQQQRKKMKKQRSSSSDRRGRRKHSRSCSRSRSPQQMQSSRLTSQLNAVCLFVCVRGEDVEGVWEELAQSAANGLGISCFLIFPN